MTGRPKKELKDFLVSEAGQRELEALAKEGKTLEQIANNYGIARNTLYTWSKANPEIKSALLAGKKVADERVEDSLYEQCFDRPTKEETMEYDSLGNIIKRTVKTKIIPASVPAIQYWLANRSEGKWKAKQQLELTGDSKAPVMFVMDIPNPYEDAGMDKCPGNQSGNSASPKEHEGH